MVSGPEVYQAYRAVELHFDPSSSYDMRKSKARVKGALGSAQAKNAVFAAIGRRVKNIGEALILFVHVKIHYASHDWLPMKALDLIGRNEKLIEQIKKNWASMGSLIEDDVKNLSLDLKYSKKNIMSVLGLNEFDPDSSFLRDADKIPETIISVITALDIWQQLMVQCTIKFKSSLYVLDRYKSFLGDALVQKGVEVVKRYMDVEEQNRKIKQAAERGESQTAKTGENEEWQALFQN